MGIKHGDVITLENGDRIKVSLEILPKPITELIAGKKYRLKHHGNYCHTKRTDGTDYSNKVGELVFQYVGEVDSSSGHRYIFFAKEHTFYSMWSTGNLDFVVEEVK